MKVLPLDNWILGEDQRKGNSVRDRFDYPAIDSRPRRAGAKNPSRISMPTYDRKTRSRIENGNELDASAR